MCRATKCRVCGKTTWAGCGMHVEAVKRGVPTGQWCDGHAASETATAPKRSWFRRKTQV